jgi:hypothetical protein
MVITKPIDDVVDGPRIVSELKEMLEKKADQTQPTNGRKLKPFRQPKWRKR